MFLRYSYSTLFSFSEKVVDHAFAMRCVPMTSVSQRVIWQKVSVIPFCRLSESTDAFGNTVMSGYLGRRHDLFAYEAAGFVQTSGWADTGQPAPVFCHASPLTVPSPEMMAAVAALSRPAWGESRSCISRLMRIISDHIAYVPGVTTIETKAEEVWRLRKGVCQDFAHVAVSLCRILGLPARYACGLMIGEGATHAWAEVFADGRWVAFDPTNGVFVGETYIKLAHGRDYSDCSIIRGAFRGGASQQVKVNVDVWEELPDKDI
ncbi:MAG: transglutaminase domain-containing protein [Marinilabiliaceae bacterium]